ncbi:MAG: hypothetical protein DI588_07095 [Flavobacterium johnsoniae]|nr:MAG: hypothetical protein DI588_07095 [Flavobacterium johnsoniae]
MDSVISGKFTETQLETFAHGRATEAEQLVKNGLEKNTKPYQAVDPKTGKEGTTIPDAFDGKQTVEFKNVRYQPETKQLRLQRAVFNAKGAKPRLIINQSTKVSKNVKANFDIQTYSIVPTTAKDNTDIPKPELPKPAPKKEPDVEVLDGQEIW